RPRRPARDGEGAAAAPAAPSPRRLGAGAAGTAARRRAPPDPGEGDALGLRPRHAGGRARERAAQEGRAGEPVAPRELRGARDPDPRPAHHLDSAPTRAQLEGRPVERQPVVLPREPERLAEPPGPGAVEARRLDPAPGPHRLEPGERLER